MPSQIQKTPSPIEEVVPAGMGWPAGWNYALPRTAHELTRPLSPLIIQAMIESDPAVASSYNTHKMAILAGGLKWTSPVKQPVWSKRVTAKPGKPDPNADTEEADAEANTLTPEQSLAIEVQEFVERAFGRLRETLGTTLFQLLDAMAYGSKMAEITYMVPADGVDAGQLVFQSIKVKPNWAWRYVVDNKMNVQGFLTFNPLGGYFVFPSDKFLWLSWMPQDADPRGTSILKAAHNAWNLKVQNWPALYKHLKRFGSPGLDLMMAPGDTTDKQDINPVTGAMVVNGDGSPVMVPVGVFYSHLLALYEAGAGLVRPDGSAFAVKDPLSHGEALFLAIELYNREIMLAIEYQTRAALEAEHGSKADSSTAQDRKGLVVSYGREWLAVGMYTAAKKLVTLRWGADTAETLTPFPTFGATEGHDRATTWMAAGKIGFKLGPSQMEQMDDELGLPVRDSQADAASAAVVSRCSSSVTDTSFPIRRAKSSGES